MGKKNIAIVFFLLLLVSCSTKHYFVIYGGKNRPTQLMFGGEWIEKDSIEQFVYRDTAQIMKLNRYFDVYTYLKGFSEYEGIPVFTKRFKIKNYSFFIHIREIGFGDSILCIDVYREICGFWVLQTCSSAPFDFPISIIVDEEQRKVIFKTPQNVIKDLPFEMILAKGISDSP